MSRSIILDFLRRAYLIHQIAEQKATSLQEAEGLLTARLSRRQTLQAGIAIAGLWGLGSPRQRAIATAARTVDPVLIVGAGIAGLTAAYRLRQAGVPVRIIEASSRPGGRLRSVTHNADCPNPVELGGEFIDTRHTAVRSLAAELGLEMADLRQADAGLVPEVWYFNGQRISPKTIVAAFAPLAKRIRQDLKAIGGHLPSHQRANPTAQRLDRLTLAEYLEAQDLDPVLNQLVRVAYITEYGQDAEAQTCLNMLFLIGKEVGQWSTYGVSDERWHVVGGNESIPRALAQHLSDGIELGTRLESIRTAPDGRYRVSLRQGDRSQEHTYERILLTVPFSVLRGVELAVEMPPLKRQAIQELGYGLSSKLAVPFYERLWRTRYASTISTYTDQEFQNTWESSRYVKGDRGWVTNLRGGIAGVRLGSGSPAAHAAKLVADLEPIFPGIQEVKRGRALRTFWAVEPYALGAYSCYLPGQMTTFGGVEGERVGNLWFAGEHCSRESQGYMNGACETAELAARSILQDLGVPRIVQTT